MEDEVVMWQSLIGQFHMSKSFTSFTNDSHNDLNAVIKNDQIEQKLQNLGPL